MNDAKIHAAVKARLTGARFSNLTDIDVNVTNRVVTLSGEVSSEAIKRDAVDEARKVEGVAKVIDNLQVKRQGPAAQLRSEKLERSLRRFLEP